MQSKHAGLYNSQRSGIFFILINKTTTLSASPLVWHVKARLSIYVNILLLGGCYPMQSNAVL